MATSELTVPALLPGLRQCGEQPVLIVDDARISYAELDRRSAHLARGLIHLGAGKGTHVGLLYPNSPDFLVAMFAVARIGAVVVPFSTFLTTPELRHQLVDSDTAILLSADAFRSHDYTGRIEQARDGHQTPVLRHVVFDTSALDESSQDVLAAMENDVDPADVLAVIYTSGSTGTPKGAVHTHSSLLRHQQNLNTIRGLTAQDRLFCNSPFFWIGGFAFGILATVLAGATLICSTATDAGATLELLEAEKPTVTNGFIAGIEHLTRHPSFVRRDLSSMRRGNLYPIMAPDCRPADLQLRHNMLGMTEAGSVVLISEDESDQPEHRRGSYGRPAPGLETRVAAGELLLRGPALMQRYYGRSREECFDADGWFHTGDMVRVDDDGFVYFLGRRGSMIKTGGANVTPAEVERALVAVCADLGHDVTAHVVGVPDESRGQVVAAVLACDESFWEFDESDVRVRLAAQLSAFKIPRRFHLCAREDVPVLSSGKVDAAALVALFDV